MTKRGRLVGISITVLVAVSLLALEAFSRRTVTVQMTDEGYNPGRITVLPGQRVTWVNADANDRWPASNSHPTHQDYPSETKSCLGSQLDACTALKTGERYSFKFDKAGSWGMHDHLEPGYGMVVDVADKPRGWLGQLQLIIDSLLNKNDDGQVSVESFKVMSYGEQQAALEKLAANDPKAAWDLLKSSYIVNGQVMQDVHEFAHLVGHAAYAKQGIGGVSLCDASFAYGCFHGVAEEAIQKQGEGAVVDIELACTEQLDERRRPSCYHGIGHGTAGIHRLALKPALGACDRMQEANRSYCYDGVFMEQATSLTDNAITKDAPWALCEALDGQYHVACARYQPVRLDRLGTSFDDGIRSCSKTAFIMLREHCARGFGYKAASHGQFMAEKIGNLCQDAGESRTIQWCQTAAATELAFQRYTGWEEQAPILCSQIATPDLRDECEASLTNVQAKETR